MGDELEPFGQQRSQHQVHLFRRRRALGFGSDVEAVGIQPIRTADDLKRLYAIGGDDQLPRRMVRERHAARLHAAADTGIGGVVALDRGHLEGRGLLRRGEAPAERHGQPRERHSHAQHCPSNRHGPCRHPCSSRHAHLTPLPRKQLGKPGTRDTSLRRSFDTGCAETAPRPARHRR
ncbi:hypothetical protein D3C83_14500 [compost metagenome]